MLRFLFFLTLITTAQIGILFGQSGSVSTTWKPGSYQCLPKTSIKVNYNIASDSSSISIQLASSVLFGAVICEGDEYKYYTEKFKVNELAITTELFVGNYCIAKVPVNFGRGNNYSTTINWPSGYRSGRAELRNLRVSKMALSGDDDFRNEVSQKLAYEAKKLQADNAWEEALKIYKKAYKLSNSNYEIASDIRELESDIDKYNDAIKDADYAYRCKQYLKALNIYQRIENELRKNDLSERRIQQIEGYVQAYNQNYSDAQWAFDHANSPADFRSARSKFERALSYLPVDKKSEVNYHIERIDARLEEMYRNHIRSADYNYHKNYYVNAAKEYLKAIAVFDRNYPQKQLKASIKGQKRILKEAYEPRYNFAKQTKDQALEQAAVVMDEMSESCHLAIYKQYKCEQSYYNKLIRNIPREVEGLIYPDKYYQKPNNHCATTNCKPTKHATIEPDAANFLTIAKRKHQLLREYSSQSFAKYRDEYIEQALSFDPNFIEAYLFKAEVSSSIVDQVMLYKKVLQIDADHQVAKEKYEQCMGQFSRSVFNMIDNNNIGELQRALQIGLLKESHQKNGKNLLQYVIFKDRNELLSILLQNQDALHPNTNLEPAYLLTQGISYESEACVELLLTTSDVNPNVVWATEEPFLIQAITKENERIVSLLLQFDAVAYCQTKTGISALHLALTKNNITISGLLLAKLPKGKIDDLSIITAVNKNAVELVETMIQKGIDLNTTNMQGETLLHRALIKHHQKLAKLLITSGSNLEIQDGWGNTPLLVAIRENQQQATNLILPKTMKFDELNHNSESPLYWAFMKGNMHTFSLLLDRNASYNQVFDVLKQENKPELKSQMALYLAFYAVKAAKSNLIDVALSYDDKVGFQVFKGVSPLELAAQLKQNTFFWKLVGTLFKTRTATKKTLLEIALDQNNIELTKYLLKKKSCNDMLTSTGYLPFFYVVRAGELEELDLVLPFFHINMQDEHGWTALHHAIDTNQSQVISWLIAHNANPKVKNNNRMHAKKFARSLKRKHLVKLLKR